MSELTEKIELLKARAQALLERVNLPEKSLAAGNLEAEMNAPGFWDDPARASWISKQVADTKAEVDGWQQVMGDIEGLLEIAREDEKDQSAGLTGELEDRYYDLKRQLDKAEITALMVGKHDAANAIVSLYAGAGGDDAQDWAEMLLRMFLRYAESKGWKAEVIDESRGGEVGIKSVTVEVRGRYAYGFFKAEAGVHRLVRLSPFDADHARHTSFAMVEVTPEIEQDADITVKEEDLQIDVFRASGHGGQSVNTTDSAVRITHLPTGIKVQCQNERSQHQNKETALKYLKGKLAKYYEAKFEEERLALRGQFTEASWGNQIRSYVLHPYKMVKDHRTKFETADPDKVLNGDLDQFIESYLSQK